MLDYLDTGIGKGKNQDRYLRGLGEIAGCSQSVGDASRVLGVWDDGLPAAAVRHGAVTKRLALT